MKRNIRATLASLSIGMMAAVAVVAAPPADQDVKQAVDTYMEKTKALDTSDRAAYRRQQVELAKAAMEGISLPEATVGQIRQLNRAQIISSAGLNDQAVARLEVLAANQDADGALAAVTRLGSLPSANMRRDGATDEDRARVEEAKKVHKALFLRAVNHPGLKGSLANGGGEIFSAVGRGIHPDVVAASVPELHKLAALITPDMPAAAAGSTVAFFDGLANVKEFSAADREKVRVNALAALRAAQSATSEDALRTRLANSAAYLDGPAARGVLIGGKTPPLQFTWSSDASLKSMDDLKGKVVIVDFWATWCGPCIGSFPNVRELQARYKDSPVVVLGITSLQGRHIDRPEGASGTAKQIDTKDNPAREYELMPTFVKQLNMGWPVVFTSQNVFNPDFGVSGIPHVAIIDPAGVVRYNNLHPALDTPGKYEKIDGLLREFELPVPAPYVAASAAAPGA